MNKKSRNKLLIVTAIIIALISGLTYASLSGKGSLAYFKTVKQIKSDRALVGETLRVGGKVLPRTRVSGKDGLRFAIGDAGNRLWVTYKGSVPSAFGDNVQVIAEGELVSPDRLNATTLVTKCPSKFKTKTIKQTGDSQ